MIIEELKKIFRVGEVVEVDPSLNTSYQGFITNVEESENDLLLSIKNILDARIESNVSYRRIKIININNQCFHRSGISRATHYSATQRQWTRKRQNVQIVCSNSPNAERYAESNNTNGTNTDIQPNTKQPSTHINHGVKELNEILYDSTTYFNKKKNYHDDDVLRNYPITAYIRYSNDIYEEGWIRYVIGASDDEGDKSAAVRTDLNDIEKKYLIQIITLQNGVPLPNNEQPSRRDVAYAFDVHTDTIRKILMRYFQSGLSVSRKSRSDTNSSVFTSDKKRKAVYTPYHAYRKKRYEDWRDCNTKIDENDIKNGYDSLTNEEKEVYQIHARINYERSVHLKDELIALMKRSDGRLTFANMSMHLGKLVCAHTIRNYLRSHSDFKIVSDRILPQLSADAMERRVVWANTYWLFWQSVLAVPKEKAIFVNVHMDEKWFYAVKCRKNKKVLTSIGVDPANYKAHHKNHIGKQMYIVVTAYVLEDNDITKGGKAVPISLIRVGKMLPAQKDSYKRVYENGRATYPKTPENQLRKKGELYFTNLELTGCSEGTEEKPKFSLLKAYLDEIIPALEEKIVMRFNKNEDGSDRKVIIVKQEDRAGLHQAREYERRMEEEFRKRDWIMFHQPPQSPVTNVHDACIFPMMSKAVSQEQAFNFGSQLLNPENLHDTVERVWNEGKHLPAIARAFLGNHQVVCAILACNGGNDYLSERKGMSFGIRKSCVTTEDRDGVVLIQDPANDFDETAQGRILALNRMGPTELKYKPPKVKTLRKASLTLEMEEILMEYMDHNLMTAELNEVWQYLLQE